MSQSGDDVFKNLGELVRDASIVPAWAPDGSSLGFVAGPAEERQAWKVDLASGKKSPLIDVERLRQAIRAATSVTPPGQGVPFEHFSFTSPTGILFSVGLDRVALDLVSQQASKLPAPSFADTFLGASPEARMTPRAFKRSLPLVDPTDAYEILSPDAKYLLSIQDRNVSLRSTYDGRQIPLTQDGTPEVEWTVDWTNPMFAALGMAVPVTNWSPGGERIALYKVDNRCVARSPQVHYLRREDEVVHRYHGKAGSVLEKHTLFILGVRGQPPVELQLGDTRDSYPIFAGWLPDESEVLVCRVSRDCRHAEVLAANPRTGAVRTLFSERGSSFVRIHHDIYFGRKLGLTLTPDGKHLLWLSERDGWKHIYQYDLQGQLLEQLTSGPWVVDGVTRVLDGFVYFTARPNVDRPYDLHLCRVPMGGGAVQQLTQGDGKHSTIIAPDGKTFIDTHSSPSTPPVTELRRIDGALLNAEVLRADVTRLDAVGFTAPEEFCVKAADGQTDLWGVIYKPCNFDPALQYPVIEYVYGGPQIAVVDHGFPTGGPFSSPAVRLAQLGCVCVMVDARGTPDRSKAFHDVAFGNFAANLAADHAVVLRQLAKKYAFIDLQRVGITGHSWGGYSAFRCLVDEPALYKAAVSSAPGFDPHSSVLYECYLGLPQDNPAAYQKADTLSLAPKAQGQLMIVCGTSDHATWSDAVKMSEALIRAGRQHELVVLPGQGHGYDSVHEDYYQKKVAAFFKRHLSF